MFKIVLYDGPAKGRKEYFLDGPIGYIFIPYQDREGLYNLVYRLIDYGEDILFYEYDGSISIE